jgi:hypothetical protein
MKYLERLAKSEPTMFGGGFMSATPYNSFPKILNTNRQAVADAIIAALPELTKEERRLAELYMQYPPKTIAVRLRLKRSVVYERLRSLRIRALELAATRKDDYLLAREPVPLDERLDCSPEVVAVRIVRFTLHDETRSAFQIERDNELLWVDDDGQLFTKEVSELLDSIDEDSPGFTFLDVETL